VWSNTATGRDCGISIPGDIQHKPGDGLEQPDLSGPALSRGLAYVVLSCPLEPILSYGSMILYLVSMLSIRCTEKSK